MEFLVGFILGGIVIGGMIGMAFCGPEIIAKDCQEFEE